MSRPKVEEAALLARCLRTVYLILMFPGSGLLSMYVAELSRVRWKLTFRFCSPDKKSGEILSVSPNQKRPQ